MLRILVIILKVSNQASGNRIRFVFVRHRLAAVIENGSGGWDEQVQKQEAREKPTVVQEVHDGTSAGESGGGRGVVGDLEAI